MAFTADCGSSTVLGALCVASTVRSLVREELGDAGWVAGIPNSEFRITDRLACLLR